MKLFRSITMILLITCGTFTTAHGWPGGGAVSKQCEQAIKDCQNKKQGWSKAKVRTACHGWTEARVADDANCYYD